MDATQIDLARVKSKKTLATLFGGNAPLALQYRATQISHDYQARQTMFE